MHAIDIWVKGHSLCEFMPDLYIPQVHTPGTIFLTLIALVSIFIHFYTASFETAIGEWWCVMVVQGYRNSYPQSKAHMCFPISPPL